MPRKPARERPGCVPGAVVRKVRVGTTILLPSGFGVNRLKSLNKSQRDKIQDSTNKEMVDHIASLNAADRRKFNELRQRTVADDSDNNNNNNTDAHSFHAFINGDEAFQQSHAGDFNDILAEELAEDMNTKPTKKHHDGRSCQDAIEKCVLGFAGQIQAMTDAYMKWGRTQAKYGSTVETPDPKVLKIYRIEVVDAFVHLIMPHSKRALPLCSLQSYSCNYNEGLGNVPSGASRCPTLSIDSWVKTLADLHGLAFKPCRAQQFTICFDHYLEIRQQVHLRILKALGPDALDWVQKRGGTERKDPQTEAAGGDYYLTREKVNLWSKERLASLVKIPTSDDPEEASACEERWKNMSEDLTSKMWGIFDETGVGELAKYPLAMVDALLNAFGPDLGGGYDIGCGFGTTIRNSPLGPQAKAMNFKCLLQYLANYVPGMGLEDLEGCERLFSMSNALARSHHDTFETYANLSKFLVNNYYQAIDIIDTEDSLKYAMEQQGIQDVSEFPERLSLELEMLKSLSHLPPAWTEKMDYYEELLSLEMHKGNFDEVFAETSTVSATVKRHAQESYDKSVDAVQQAEVRLSITKHWTREDPLWLEAATLVAKQRYHKCVNKLEELILKRMFELTKMNMSQTGYKMRKHIAKALQTRSKAIRTALKNYNTAAESLTPPARTLEWAEVIDYMFLADFNLLRGGIQSDALRPWATPAAQMVLDAYFRIERAKEEVIRLDIEIRRVVTHIRDERAFFVAKEQEFNETDPCLAFAIRQHRFQRERFDNVHMDQFRKLEKKLGRRFTGTLVPGVQLAPVVVEPEMMDGVQELGREAAEAEALDFAAQMENTVVADDSDSDWEEDDGEEAEEERVAEMMETVLTAAIDT
ncbi:hypothetical protein C8J57DRAFT_1535947 [Mycena rebaudengoi]|nr:hypothetical protein C8J57DRAFT_1535947 [Mycena rebaudengoi]